MCSQVSEPRAGCHASGHSWRIHLSSGVSSSSSGCSQWAVPRDGMNSAPTVTERTENHNAATTTERAEAAAVNNGQMFVCLYLVLIFYLNKKTMNTESLSVIL